MCIYFSNSKSWKATLDQLVEFDLEIPCECTFSIAQCTPLHCSLSFSLCDEQNFHFSRRRLSREYNHSFVAWHCLNQGLCMKPPCCSQSAFCFHKSAESRSDWDWAPKRQRTQIWLRPNRCTPRHRAGTHRPHRRKSVRFQKKHFLSGVLVLFLDQRTTVRKSGGIYKL